MLSLSMSDHEPLTTLMASGPMPLEEILRIGREAAAALTSVHGELWPSVMLVGSSDVQILPAGAADRSRYGQYSAPERTLGKPATPQSDVFSLGAILFHALTGRPAFKGSTAAEVMLSACADAPLDLRSFRPDVPREIASVIQRCLVRDPAERHPSPQALARALMSMQPRKNWPGRRILVADDDAPVRDLHAHILAQVGVEADVVSSGRDAIAALKSQRYDIALLDLHMPRLSGWEVLDFLRVRKELKPSKVFIITGFGDQSMSEADRSLVNAVLYKPVVADELSSLVTRCLGGEEVDVDSVLRTTAHKVANGMAISARSH